MNGHTVLENDILLLSKKDPNADVKTLLLKGELVNIMSKDTNKGVSWRYVEWLENGMRGYVNWTENEAKFYKWEKVRLLEDTKIELEGKRERRKLDKETTGYFLERRNPLDLYVRFQTEDGLVGVIDSQVLYKKEISQGVSDFIHFIVILFVGIFVLLAICLSLSLPIQVLKIGLILFSILSFYYKYLRN